MTSIKADGAGLVHADRTLHQEEIISALMRILSGLALGGALAVPTFAATSPQQGDSLPNGSMLIIWPDGTMARVHIINSSTADAAMPQATQATHPTMVIVENGHACLVPDRQLADGKMMSDDMSDTSNPNVSADTQSQGAQPQGTTKQ